MQTPLRRRFNPGRVLCYGRLICGQPHSKMLRGWLTIPEKDTHGVVGTKDWKPGLGNTPQEQLVSLLPAAASSIGLLLGALASTWLETLRNDIVMRQALLLCGLVGSLYTAGFSALYLAGKQRRPFYAWMNAVLVGLGLGLLHLLLPESRDFVVGFLLVGATITSASVSGRGPTYLLASLALASTSAAHQAEAAATWTWAFEIGSLIVSIAVIETIQQLKHLSRRHIDRLEAINEFGRKVASAPDSQGIAGLLGETLLTAFEADTYLFGLADGEDLRFSLLYDDGEYFGDVVAPLEGSLSGWVIQNGRALFLPDLRTEVNLPGVRDVVAGRSRTSLSWLGVPVQSGSIAGVLALASYRPHAFHESEMELLSNMAGHAALALDNAERRERLEKQALVDSLTGAYNHGAFLRLLSEFGEKASVDETCLSLIMLDIDLFKQYNDRYGHLAGDSILAALCATIRSHLKRTDVLGRWGGEEFAIILPRATGSQALQVADRIRASMPKVEISVLDKTFPAPTVSQGIAEFPREATDLMQLVDLADRRLYVAKQRGRDQVEPGAENSGQRSQVSGTMAGARRPELIY